MIIILFLFLVVERVETFKGRKLSRDVPMTLTVDTITRAALLRPPSVVVSDHDLCQEEGETFVTLDDLDAEYNQTHQRRRLSDCSTCSSLSFSELDFNVNTPGEEEVDEPCNKVSLSHFTCLKFMKGNSFRAGTSDSLARQKTHMWKDTFQNLNVFSDLLFVRKVKSLRYGIGTSLF